VFFDVGAHVGLISCQVAAARPAVVIHGFEPHPRVAAMFRTNAELNGYSAVLVEAAASDSDGHVVFNLDSHAIGRGDTSVPSLRLDDYIATHAIDHVDVMKLDVEGHEREVLDGARRSLASGVIRAVTMESMAAHGKDVNAPAQIIESLGFTRRPMPDIRPAWVRRLRYHLPANVAYVRSTSD